MQRERSWQPAAPNVPLQGAAQQWAEFMRLGDFANAWETSDAITRAGGCLTGPGFPRHLQSIWNGSSIDGARVLIRCYHGLGDTLQFIRYAPLVRTRARRVTVWAQPELLPIVSSVRGIDLLLPLHDGDVGVEFDVDVEVMELPYLFRTTVQTIPTPRRYVDVLPAHIGPTRRPAIGLVWRAGDWDPTRSIPVGTLAPLLSRPASWYALQRNPGSMEWPRPATLRGRRGVLDLARLVRSLDLLITIDSMPAHLAGALGIPVWTLLCADADWRWIVGRDDTPWYPTMRLFRQERVGDWQPVVARVANELDAFIARHAGDIAANPGGLDCYRSS